MLSLLKSCFSDGRPLTADSIRLENDLIRVKDRKYFPSHLMLPFFRQIANLVQLKSSGFFDPQLLARKMYNVFELGLGALKSIAFDSFESMALMRNFIDLQKSMFNALVLNQFLSVYIKNKGDAPANRRVHDDAGQPAEPDRAEHSQQDRHAIAGFFAQNQKQLFEESSQSGSRVASGVAAVSG